MKTNLAPLEEVRRNAWPEPDLSILNEGRRPPPPFTSRPFGSFWAEWIARMAELKGTPPDYIAATLMAVAGSLIGGARSVSPWQGWTEPPALWVANVGNPSSGKSPAQDAVFELVRTIQQELLPSYDDAKLKWEDDKEVASIALSTWKKEVETALKKKSVPPPKPDAAQEPEPPVRPRLFVSDTTPESLAPKLAAQPKGLMVQRDELAGWLLGMDRYTSGKAERAMWLEAFGGRPYIIDRVKHGDDPVVVARLAIPIVGALVPENVPKVMGGLTDDGLASRFLFVWPEPKRPTRPEGTLDSRPALAALRRLYGLQMGTDDNWQHVPIVVRLTDDAATLFQEWREKNYQEEDTAHGLYLGHLGKLPGITLRIAFILEFLWWSASGETAPPEKVSLDAITIAANLVDDYHKPMARRVCGDAAVSEPERHAAAIAREIRKRGATEINMRSVRRDWGLHGLREASAVKAAFTLIEEAGLIRPKPGRVGDRPGRQRADYLVNPTLHKAYYG